MNNEVNSKNTFQEGDSQNNHYKITINNLFYYIVTDSNGNIVSIRIKNPPDDFDEIPVYLISPLIKLLVGNYPFKVNKIKQLFIQLEKLNF